MWAWLAAPPTPPDRSRPAGWAPGGRAALVAVLLASSAVLAALVGPPGGGGHGVITRHLAAPDDTLFSLVGWLLWAYAVACLVVAWRARHAPAGGARRSLATRARDVAAPPAPPATGPRHAGAAPTVRRAPRPVASIPPGLPAPVAGVLSPMARFRQAPWASRLAADDGAVRFVDLATRLLAAALAARGRPLPPVYAAVLSDDGLDLRLAPAPPQPPPAPWEVGAAAGTWWLRHLPDTLDGLAPEQAVAIPPGTRAPFPALAAVGRDAAGAWVLVDVGAAPGVVAIGGDEARARGVALSIGVELGTNDWSRDLRVVLVGFTGSSGPVVPGRLRAVTRLGEVLAELESTAAGGGAAAWPATDPLVAAWAAGGGRGVCDLVVLAAPPTGSEAVRLARLASGPRRSVGVVVAGEMPGAPWVFTVHRDGWLFLGVLGLEVRAERLRAADLAALADLARGTAPATAAPIAEPDAPPDAPALPAPVPGPAAPARSPVEPFLPVWPEPDDGGAGWAPRPAPRGAVPATAPLDLPPLPARPAGATRPAGPAPVRGSAPQPGDAAATRPGQPGPVGPPPTSFPVAGALGEVSLLLPRPRPVAPPAPPAPGPPPPAPTGPLSPVHLPYAIPPAPAAGTPARGRGTGGGGGPEGSVVIRLLGHPEVDAPGPVARERVDLLTEFVVLLALRPDGVWPADLTEALWPRGASAEEISGVIRQVRRWLGTDARGLPRLVTPNGRARLTADVRCDWWLFSVLARGNDPDDLREALSLVTGPPLHALPAGRYGWLAGTGQVAALGGAVVDAAHRLAAVTLAAGDPVAAYEACQTGLRAVPGAQMLWRDLLRVLAGHGEMDALVGAVSDMFATIGADLAEPETVALVGALLPDGGPGRQG